MPRIEEIKEPGYYFLISKKPLPDPKIIEVSPNKNNAVITTSDPIGPMLTKEKVEFSYELPQPQLIKPSLTELTKEAKYVALDMNNEVVESSMPNVAENMNHELLSGEALKLVASNMNKTEAGSHAVEQVKQMLKEGAGNKSIEMVKPMSTEGAGNKGIEMVKPMSTEGAGDKGIAMVEHMTLDGFEDKGIAMVDKMTLEGAGGKGIAMVHPMTLENAGSHGVVSVYPMFKEELVPSDSSGITWSKGVVVSKYPMVQGADLMESLSNHLNDTVKAMTTGFVDNIKSWMREKREELKKEFHNFVSTTMRDYQNAIMDPANTLVKNAIKNPTGTLQEFPKNLKMAFSDVGQGLLNTSVDAALSVGNKARDYANTAISMGNTAVKAMNAVNKFFGGKGKEIPLMKTVPKLPTREELLNQAVMKGGSLAKMSPISDFDVQAFKDIGKAGEIDREKLKSMASTPVYGLSLPDDYALWNGTPLWFTLEENCVAIDESNPPVIIDNNGRETVDTIGKEGRKIGEKSYNYAGFREGEFKSVMEGIYKGTLGFQAQPDIYCDISITPHKFKVTGGVAAIPIDFYPPAYPKDKLGDYMVADFQAYSFNMNAEEAWNLGVYGQVPLVVNYILPSSLSIRFVGDANLKVAKWLTAYQEYMSGYSLNPHVMRPYKMCCQEITLYALTFYGEVVHAKTYLAYPLLKDDYAMLGSGGAKHFDVEWVVVGLKEFSCKPDMPSLEQMTPDATEGQLEEMAIDENAVASESTATTADTEETAEAEGLTVSGTNVSATLNTNDVTIAAIEGSSSSKATTDTHTSKFLEVVGNSQSVANKLKALTEDESVKSIAEKFGVSEAMQKISKYTDLDILTKKGCRYLICVYANHVAKPSYGDTKIPYNSTDRSATYKGKSVVDERFAACDKLAQYRAAEYVKSFVQEQGVDKSNIKVILGSCDGIPGMNHFITGTAMTGGYYIGGVHQYTKEECQIDNGDGNTAGLANNRRVDLIYFDDFVADYPDAIDELMGKGSSDARGNETKLAKLWNRIPKVSWGRDTTWGSGGERYPIMPAVKSLFFSDFSCPGGGVTTTAAKDVTTNEEKVEKIEQETQEVVSKVSSGVATEQEVKQAAEAYKKKEEVKQSVTYDQSVANDLAKEGFPFKYRLKTLSSVNNFSTQSQDTAWFNKTFGAGAKAKFFGGSKTFPVNKYYTEYADLQEYFSKAPVLSVATSNGTTSHPVMMIYSTDLFGNNVIINTDQKHKDCFLINAYMLKSKVLFLYVKPVDILVLFKAMTTQEFLLS